MRVNRFDLLDLTGGRVDVPSAMDFKSCLGVGAWGQ
jgi:hypothetical protein